MENNIEKMRRKRYGQFFSGKRVAELLVDMIPEDIKVNSVIDPMAGSGDLLQAVLKRYPGCKDIVGVDIDPIVIERNKMETKGVAWLAEDAFKSVAVRRDQGWDLVITNPPYVRYQLLNSNDIIGLPTGEVIRENLAEAIEKNKAIEKDEKELFRRIVENYSGLSDLAVPSWILCSSIVKRGGYLAMVVPETWLNRDYALPIHYMLLKLYDVLTIVKDAEASWFENASVRTCLVIARKKAEGMNSQNFCGRTRYIEMGTALSGKDSLTEKLIIEDKKGREAFAWAMKDSGEIEFGSFSAKTVATSLLFPKLTGGISSISWVEDEKTGSQVRNGVLPWELSAIFRDGTEYESLEKMGWKIGQGLRTGANEFFYGNILGQDALNGHFLVQTRAWNGEKFSVPESCVRLAIQNRGDIKGLCVKTDLLHKCIFYIQNSCTESDFKQLSPSLKSHYNILEKNVQGYIEKAEEYTNPKNSKKFKELSAVAPNEKKEQNEYQRFWYMLPALKRRHVPDLCISRLCGKDVECLYIKNLNVQRIVVDANFVTLWNDQQEEHAYAYALLNSTWFKCYMEYIGTRMGGGALKIEASQVKQVLFPRLSEYAKRTITELGKQLMEESGNLDNIICEIDRNMFWKYEMEDYQKAVEDLHKLLSKKLKERGVYDE